MARPQIFLKHLLCVIFTTPHTSSQSLFFLTKMFPVSSVLKPFLPDHSLKNFCQSESHSLWTCSELSMPLTECCTQEGLLCWRWKQTLTSEYTCEEQTPSCLCVCPSTSKAPIRSDAGRGLAITKFGGSVIRRNSSE